jgi:hypothetical protein
LKRLSLTIFTNNFITTVLGISPHEIGKKITLFTLRLGADIRPQPKTQLENHWNLLQPDSNEVADVNKASEIVCVLK